MPRGKNGARKSKPVKIQVGNHSFTYGKGLTKIDDSTDLYLKSDFKALRHKLETVGYIFIRGVIPQQTALAARKMMLKQASKDGSVINTKSTPFMEARMTKQNDGKTWSEGYCVDGITGSETNERENIDEDAWLTIGPSKTMKDVYCGDSLKTFWQNLFYENNINSLVKQTFLRLMGDSGTQEHADYYYFKKDTHIFSGKDGRSAINALKQYRIKNRLPLEQLDESIARNLRCSNNNNSNKNAERLFCHICEKDYLKSSLDNKRLNRLRRGGFGVSGEWHCPKCAIECFGIYTTWVSLSNLSIPKDSILALCPYSHNLKEWDIPKPKDRQLCGDFNWRMPWVIPESCNPGDIIIFNIKTIHASSLNVTNPKIYRVSCDTRILLTHGNNNNNNNNNSEEKESASNENDNTNDDNFNDRYQTPHYSRKRQRRINKKCNPSPHPPLSVSKIENNNNENKNGNNNEMGNDKENANISMGHWGNNSNGYPMMTRSRARQLAQMNNRNNLQRAQRGGGDDATDDLTSSMSDLMI